MGPFQRKNSRPWASCDCLESLKKLAAEAAAQRVESGQVIGLGTGSTARYFLEAPAKRVKSGALRNFLGVPTSTQTQTLARSLGLPLATLNDHPRLDLSVDGADEVDPALNLIKGMGGALLREKIVAAASARFIVIADSGKLVQTLGERTPVPVEVLPFGWKVAALALQALGGKPQLRLHGDAPAATDQGNYLLDAAFGPIAYPASLATQISAIPGVLGHGLFLGMADMAIVGAPDGVRVLTA